MDAALQGSFLQNFDSENAKIFIVISGISYNIFGEFNPANFGQMRKLCAFFCYEYCNYLSENPSFK